jgi:hypothetical protein
MSKNNELYRETDERIRATIDGIPDSEWDGLSGADIWWVLTDDEDGGTVVESFQNSDAELTVVQNGGGADAAEITVDLDATVTAGLDAKHYWQAVIVRDSSGELSAAELDPHRFTMKESAAAEVTS